LKTLIHTDSPPNIEAQALPQPAEGHRPEKSHLEAFSSFSRKALWPVLLLLAMAALAHMIPLPFKEIFLVFWSAILLATIISPAATYMQNRWRIPRWLTPLGIYVGFIVLLAGAVALVIPLAVHETRMMSHDLPLYFEKLRPWLAKVAPGQAEKFTTENMVKELSGRLAGFADVLGSMMGFLLGGSVKMLLILFMALFMVADTHLVKGAVERFFPASYSDTVLKAMADCGEKISKWARAQMLLALFFGVTFGLSVHFIGLPYALTFGVAGAVLEAIPYVGGAVTLVLALLVAITQGSTLQVILTLAFYFAIVEVQGHLLAPKLMDRFLHMRPIIVILALFVGEESMGVLGALFGIPLAIIVLEVINQFFPAREQAEPAPAAIPLTVPTVEIPPASAPVEEVETNDVNAADVATNGRSALALQPVEEPSSRALELEPLERAALRARSSDEHPQAAAEDETASAPVPEVVAEGTLTPAPATTHSEHAVEDHAGDTEKS
jgi:predicted PurR-regulated permease PerM